jgi:hypothetical protein
MSKDVFEQVKSVADKHGVPVSVWYPIAMTESGGNPSAPPTISSKEKSIGLFQINTLAHPDANSSQLYNPVYNAEYIMPTLKQTMDAGIAKGLTGSQLTSYVEKYGERPQWTSQVQNNINKYYAEITGENAGANLTDTITETTTNSSLSIMDKIKVWLINIGVFLILLLCAYLIFFKGGSK